jgi:N-methylhydantoinase A/oxoprolinase/acetone carboxylase beta subunit
MGTVFVHKYAGILSAYGMALADVVHEAQEPCAKIYEPGKIVSISVDLLRCVLQIISTLLTL